jgi:phosphatidylserine decarboxylase
MSLLFNESPFLGTVPILGAVISYQYKSNIGIGVCVAIFLALLAFYRYTPFTRRFDDEIIVSPCEGKVLIVEDRHDYYYIPIFLSVFNKHSQIYPANGTVISRKYDHTGKFDIVMYLDKSADNEKKIHALAMKNGAVMSITQLAGLLPRMITSSDKVPEPVLAGQYLGMIKFGSRIDLLIPKKAPDNSLFVLDKHIKKDACVSIGDVLGMYLPPKYKNANDHVDGYLAAPNYSRDTQTHRSNHIPSPPASNRIHIRTPPAVQHAESSL